MRDMEGHNHDRDEDEDEDEDERSDSTDSIFTGDEENQHRDVEQEAGQQKGSKDDIYVRVRSSFSIGMPPTSTSLYSPKTCAICLENYKENDGICWSHNKKCAHAFHLDCMTGWLMTGIDDCPLCRENYLENAGD
mmetsp:Transcript_11877/g.17337  ORF Transcript_11877/g.17337 Transcript_11877/m.17337 type:complete len:135 (+) Transcript_11877:207-611(+)